MIRVNLVRDRSTGQRTRSDFNLNRDKAAGAGISFSYNSETDSSGNLQTTLFLKLIVFVLPLVSLIGYETYNVGIIESELRSLDAQIQESTEKLASYGEKVIVVKKFKEEETVLLNRVSTIKELSKERLFNVKALDALHGIIPAKAWLTNLDFKNNTFIIEGLAVEDIVVSNLIANLEQSIYFSQVRLVYAQEFRNAKGALRKFRLSGTLGRL